MQETLLRNKSSFASDVYMFGAFMFETLADVRPFADVSEIGAVQASVDAGVAAAKRAGELVAAHVIARPHALTEKLLYRGPAKVVRALAE